MRPIVGCMVIVLLLGSAVALGQTTTQSQVGYPALQQVSYTYNGGSARAMAMGYAFVGLSNDVSSGLWNPAGLWILESPIMSTSYNLYAPKGQFSHSLTPFSVNNDLNASSVGHFSFVAPVRIKGHPWVFNFNYNRSSEFADKSAYLNNPDNNVNPDTYIEDKGHMNEFAVGASTRLYKQLSFGFTVNIFDIKRIYDQVQYTVSDSIINEVYGIVAEKIYSDEIVDSTSSTGVNFMVGFMLKQPKYSLGLVARTPFTLKHSTDRARFEQTTLNGLESTEGTQTIFVVDSVAKQDIPVTLTGGIGLFPKENLTLTADLSYQNYGSTNWFYRSQMFFEPNGDRVDSFEEFPIDWNNIMGIGVGAEYRLETKYGRIPFRAGFRFDQLPQPKTITVVSSNVGYDGLGEPFELDIVNVDRVAEGRQNETSFSLGTGIGWSQIEIDFAWRYATGAEMTLSETGINFDEFDEENPVKTFTSTRKWERKEHEFRFTFTGYF